MRSSFSWFVREKIGHVSVLLPKIHFITITLFYRISYGYCNAFKFITLRGFKTVSHVYIMGLPHLLKVR